MGHQVLETRVRQIWSRIHKMYGKVEKTSVPGLNDGCFETVGIEKADMPVKIFQDVLNPKSLGEDGFRIEEEVLKAEKWKLKYICDGNSL